MAVSVASFCLSDSHLGGRLEGKRKLVKGIKSDNWKKSSRNGFGSSVSIKCFKGQLIPSAKTLELIKKNYYVSTTNGGVVPSTIIPLPSEQLSVNDFPADFLFGASTSALQSEGSLDVDGRGPSTWDSLITDGIAADSYNRYKEDVEVLKNMGANSYRLSISWSRILPDGTVEGGINQKGIDFYNNLIDELVNNGITPFVTLFHFDFPQGIQSKYSGLLSRNVVQDFKDYADICFKNFGDRVKHWVTINEPHVFGQYLYALGLPDTTIQNPLTDAYTAMHNIILAHAAAATHYKQNYQPTQNGEIGISLSGLWLLPHSNTREDRNAAQRGIDFSLGWILDPLVYGDYPFSMKSLVREALPRFTEEETALVKGSYDFIGMNYYSARFADALPILPSQQYNYSTEFQHLVSTPEDVNGNLIGEQVNNEMFIFPKGLKSVLLFLKDEYHNPKVYITENGTPDPEGQGEIDPLNDTPRIEFIKAHLRAILEALKLGANVKGFFNWSMMDLKELAEAIPYTTRMGLIHIPYPDRDRIPKKSSQWLNEFLSQRKK